ncbi:MAG: bacillithiol system redox-active protein YtxJ [Crocinitomicaceae bacterium]|jgi:bacillithiol system protein YtxJ|nr:bacillithiol system redox-active protein YtxJ [Crocinitomicaceae bacterium]MDP4866956.1 bacillithiol system redox-active protein YtxJ [Crocinitomicaceae bacterium]MDP5011980.1 bacillithiol system redox-active protein YtxJ [Crocinitomicaceae bacterium]
MGLFSSSKPKAIFPWKNIESIQMLDELVSLTQDNAVLIFKHSTRCSISMMALTRFESEWDLNISSCDLYFLDLITHRDISNKIAEITGVIHQSPQVIVLRKGEVLYEESHNSISARDIKKEVNS